MHPDLSGLKLCGNFVDKGNVLKFMLSFRYQFCTIASVARILFRIFLLALVSDCLEDVIRGFGIFREGKGNRR